MICVGFCRSGHILTYLNTFASELAHKCLDNGDPTYQRVLNFYHRNVSAFLIHEKTFTFFLIICRRQEDNRHDRYAVAVYKSAKVVGRCTTHDFVHLLIISAFSVRLNLQQ